MSGGEFTVDRDLKGLVRVTIRADDGQMFSFSTDAPGAVRLSDFLRKGAGAPNPWTTRKKLLAFIHAATLVVIGLGLALIFFTLGIGVEQISEVRP